MGIKRRTSFKNLMFIVIVLAQFSCTLNVSVTDLNSKNVNSEPGNSDGDSPSKIAAADFLISLSVINSYNKSSYFISGNCAYVSSVDIKINGNSIGTAVCSSGVQAANGTWSKTVDTSSIVDGNLSFQLFDILNNSSLTLVQTVLKDTVLPVAGINTIPPATNNLTSISSSVFTTDTAEYSYKVGIAASTDCSSTTGYSGFINVGTSISHNISAFADGNLRMCIVAKDSAGNIQDYASATIYNWAKDTSVPTAVLSGTPAANTNSASYNVTVGGASVTHYAYKLGLVASTDCSNSSGYSSQTVIATNISGSLASGDGNYKLCVIGKNAGGTWQAYASATTYTWALDTAAPTLAITSPSSGAYINSSNQGSYSITSSCSENGVSVSLSATSTVNAAVVSGSGTCSAGSVTVSLNLSGLQEGGVNLSSSQTDLSGNTGTSANVLISKDTVSPTLAGSVTDGTYYASLSQSPSLSWSAGSDIAGSGIQKYQIALGTSSGGTQILNWTDIGSVTTYQVTSLSLTEATTYYPSVRVVDNAGNASSVINGDGWITDTVGPVSVASVEDGDQIVSTTYSSWISWAATTDAGSGLASYEVRIVDSGNAGVTSWVNVGTILGYGFTGLTLTEGQTYKAQVRAIDNLGNVGTATQGNGWYVVPQGWKQQAYLKAPNANVSDAFGYRVAADGDTIVVTAYFEDSNQTTITNGTTASSDNSAGESGAAYVFKRTGTTWAQEAYLKAPNADAADYFGFSAAVSGDTSVVGAYGESSNQTTITNGTTASSNNSASQSGAVYVFKRTGTTWAQEAYLKAPNAEAGDSFGYSVSVSGDTIAVGAYQEDSNQTTITNGTTASSDNSASAAGAAYVFKRTGTTWAQEAYLKAPNAEASDNFGYSVSVSGETIVVGAYQEDSNQTTITNGTTASGNNSVSGAGAAYVFQRTGVTWAQEAYLKAPNADANDNFGLSVAISGDTIVVGAFAESSNQTTITNGTTASSDNSASFAGAAYVFKRTGVTWAQEAYLKAPNAESVDTFGANVAISGETIVVGASGEDSNQTTITNGTTASGNNSASAAGAAYVFKRTGVTWSQEAYLKAPNANGGDMFGSSVSVSGDTVVVGAMNESSSQTTITNGATASSDNSVASSGAAYVFTVDRSASWTQQAYAKAPNAETNDLYGNSVSISGDTVVVGAPYESSNQTTITNGTTASSDNSMNAAGAVYILKRTGSTWAQEAYIKAANAGVNDWFGTCVASSGDTVIVGAYSEDSNQTTITNGTTASANNSISSAGAAYVYKRTGTSWAQEAYLKAANAETGDWYGYSVAISGDTIAVGARFEDSNQITITNGTTASANNTAGAAGAVYVYKRTGVTWAQEAYLKAPNAETNDQFGVTVAISGDTIVVGAISESSNQTTITNGTTASSDNSAAGAGAVYVYKRTGVTWAQEAYIKAANSQAGDTFGNNVGISGDTIVVGANNESSSQTTITNGTTASSDNSAAYSGAAYVYKRTGVTWAQEAYLKAPNAEANDYFGTSVGISGDTIVVGTNTESSNQTTITNGTTASNDNSASSAGAVYVFKRTGVTWAQEAYLKAPNAEASDAFGNTVAISGSTVVVGSSGESSNQTTITNGTTASSDNSTANSGAVYIFKK